jgi:hypothetical protein
MLIIHALRSGIMTVRALKSETGVSVGASSREFCKSSKKNNTNNKQAHKGKETKTKNEGAGAPFSTGN